MADPFGLRRPLESEAGFQQGLPASMSGFREVIPAGAAGFKTPLPETTSQPGQMVYDESTGQFARGLRQGMLGTEANLRGFAANVAETIGAPEFAKSQLQEVGRIKDQMGGLQPDVTDVTKIGTVPQAFSFAASSLGQALPTVATAVAGGLAARVGARGLGLRPTPGQAEFLGAAGGIFPQEAGEASLNMYSSPEAMQLSPGQRLAIATGKGAVGSALEAIVPAAVLGRVARGVAPVLERGLGPAAKYIGTESLKAGGVEALTEGAQSVSGQMFQKLSAPETEDLLPSQSEFLTSMAAGFLPGKAMGAVGSTAEVLRSKFGSQAAPTDRFRTLTDVVQNPQLSQFVRQANIPDEVLSKGQGAVAQWMVNTGYIDNVLQKARDVASDATLSDSIRARAQEFVDSGGDPDLLTQFTGLATAQQRGAEVGETVRQVGSEALRTLFGRRQTEPGTRFSAMEVPLTEADAPLVSALSPYLRDSGPESLQMAIPVIRDYLRAVQDDSSAAMPVGLLNLFKDNKSRDGLRSAIGMMQRMGELNLESNQLGYDSYVDDVIERQRAWNKLIDSNLDPVHGSISVAQKQQLASKLESLAAETTMSPGDSDVFIEAVRTAFGKNAPRVLDQMQELLPRGIQSVLTSQEGQRELSEIMPRDMEEAPTSEAGLASIGFATVPGPEGVKWNFANNTERTLYDMSNPEQVGWIQQNAARMARSGTAEAVPTGVVDYARQTGDQTALTQAQEAMPGATEEQLNERFQVLGVYQTARPVAEQVTYDELVSQKDENGKTVPSPWRAEFGAIKFYEPGKTRASLVTTPAKIISRMRERSPEQNLSGAEAALSDFANAMAALLTVEKNGQLAFDRVEIMTQDGKYVPFSELPDNFTLFRDVSVADAKQALAERLKESGVQPVKALGRYMPPQRYVSPTLGEMDLTELREQYAAALEKYNEAKSESPEKKSAERKIKAIRKEVKRRLIRDGLDSSPDSIKEALLESTEVTPTTLAPDVERTKVTRGAPEPLRSVFTTRQAAEDFLADQGRGTITQDGPNFVVTGYAERPGQIDRSTTPSELEDFAESVGDLGDEDTVTPGDIEAAKLGPRLFQEETGQLLQPNKRSELGNAKAQLTAMAKKLYDAVAKAAQSSLRNTIQAQLNEAVNSELSESDMRGRIKAAERAALQGELITFDDAQFQHRGLEKRKTPEAKPKFTSMDPINAEPMTDDDKAEVKAWLDRVLPEFTLQFVKELGGMSGSYSRSELGQAIIRVNVHAYDPLSVAYHEAVHDLFVLLAEGGHQGVIDMLTRLSSSKLIQAQLKKLLEGNPKAIAQLKDPEEAAAYLFQFWMIEKINLGPQNQSLFDKIWTSVRKFLGLLTDQELTEKLFTMFNEGALKDSVSRNEALTNFGSSAAKQLLGKFKPLTEQIGKLTDTVDARFRESGNPFLANIIDGFNTAAGQQTTQVGYFAAVAQVRNRLVNKLSEQFRGYNRAQLDEALDALQKGTNPSSIKDPEIQKLVRDIRKTLNQLHDYMVRKGVTKWTENGGEAPLGFIKDYFPRVWDVDTLVADGDKFVDDLLKYHEKELTELAQAVTKSNEDKGITAPVDARAVAEAILAKLTRNSGLGDDATMSPESALKENLDAIGFSPAMAAANERILKFLDMNVFAKYLEKDLVKTMTQYISQAAKRAEYSERFGSHGQKLADMFDKAEQFEIDKILSDEYGRQYKARKEAALRKTPQKPKEPTSTYLKRALDSEFEGFGKAYDEAAASIKSKMDSFRTGVMALEGTLGHDISPGLRTFNSTMMTYQNLRTIPLALFSSIIDPLGIVVRGGEVSQAYSAFKRGLREVMKSWKGEFTGAEDPDVMLAELIGTLEPSSYLDSLGQTYGSMFMTGTSRRLNDVFFRLNGMEGWNRAMRTQATVAAIEFIKKFKTRPDEHTDRYLKELGLTLEDIKIKEDGTLDLSSQDKRLQFAIMRWVDGAILRPNAAQRPAWASNPKYALFFHLSQFTYSFQKVILTRMYNEAKNGNYDPLMVAAAGYIPLMLASNVIRAFIQGGGDEPEWMKDDTLVDWVSRAYTTAGLNGVPGMIMERMPLGLAGPTVQQAADILFKDRPMSEDVIRALPFNPVYRDWVN